MTTASISLKLSPVQRGITSVYSSRWRLYSLPHSKNVGLRERQVRHTDKLIDTSVGLVTSIALCSLLLACPTALAEDNVKAEFSVPSPLSDTNSVGALFRNSLEDEEIDPFTLYGKTLKKYLIEKIEEGKIVGRKKGFTVNTCVGAMPEILETPQFRSLSQTEKEESSEERICVENTGKDLSDTCTRTCNQACSTALDLYGKVEDQKQGLKFEDKQKANLERRCNRQCVYECKKPGKISDFYIPSRN